MQSEFDSCRQQNDFTAEINKDGGISMSNMILRFASKTTGLGLFMTLLCSTQWIYAQPAPQPIGARPDTLTTNIVYEFLYDGLVPSGFSHGDILYDELIQGADDNFYGTTAYGGSGTCANGFGVIGCGTVFKLTPSGTQTVLYNFTYDSTTNTAVNGAYPYGGLVQGKDGNFYGTTSGGGNAGAVCNGNLGCGVIFKITPAGKFTLLHTFQGALAKIPEGGGPVGRLILASNGTFYGTTYSGGLVQNFANQGTIFAVSPSGGFTTVYMFDNIHGTTDGANPYAGLIQGKDGSFYGTTQFGGTSNAGTVFKFAGSKTTMLHSFPWQPGQFYPDGAYPKAALVQASDLNLYGATSYGGVLTTYYQSGTLFRVTTKGVFTKLWDFNSTDSSVNGISPYGGLIQASDGNLYGTTTAGGGTANSGTVYQFTLGGVLSQVMSFDAATTGALPEDVPSQASDGTLYITNNGGTVSYNKYQGAIVQVATGLPAPKPVVARFAPTSGKVGQKVTISGGSFVGTTGVAFNGTAATFTVKSSNTIIATVPSGAATGPITVTNGGGSTTSAQSFTVLP
jgi:uncharacterized repeat protein (TIGR03803 family)